MNNKFGIDLVVGATKLNKGYGLNPHFFLDGFTNNSYFDKIIKFIEKKYLIKCEIVTTTLMVGDIDF